MELSLTLFVIVHFFDGCYGLLAFALYCTLLRCGIVSYRSPSILKTGIA